MLAALVLAAKIWTWWIAVVLTPVVILAVLATIGGYLYKVTGSRYPRKR
ncbi:MAG: hypothetical protein KDB21_09315 [Acidimicrobiales bacterium]|nr:hypothetical protein [Acidimicrobiales bacterium]